MNYYNENDKKMAAWLEGLIRDGLIPKGHVDVRSITDVRATDLLGYTQHHFFAGLGGWPYALQLAGWPEDKPVWTGSCPCQPFSSAGKQKGQADERHLWPAFFELIKGYNAIGQREPVTVFGEQVSSAIRHGWLDGICSDLEGEGYTVGSCVLGAHSVSAPHIRQRLYWVADPGQVSRIGRESEQRSIGENEIERNEEAVYDQRSKPVIRMANASEQSGKRNSRGLSEKEDGERGSRQQDGHQSVRSESDGSTGRLGNTKHDGPHAVKVRRGFTETGFNQKEGQDVSSEPAGTSGREESGDLCLGRLGITQQPRLEGLAGDGGDGYEPRRDGAKETGSVATAGTTITVGMAYTRHYDISPEQWEQLSKRNSWAGEPGYWDDYQLIPCRDGKARRVKSGLRCLAHGVPFLLADGSTREDVSRATLLKGLGNAIVPPLASEFIRSYMESVWQGE